MNQTIDVPMVHEEYMDDFLNLLVAIAHGGSDDPRRDAQAMLKMLSPEHKEIVLNSFPSGELHELISNHWPRYVGDTEGPYL